MYYTDWNGIKIMENKFKELLGDLTSDERAEAIKILNEMSDCNGHSELLQALYDEDYEEIPVDIDTFIESDEYCGKTTKNGKNIYPYWRERLRELFTDPGKYQEVAVTGCLSGDTIIPLLNGKKVTIKTLADIGDLDEYVYSFDVNTNKYVSGHLIKAFSTGVKDTYKITLDNGKSIIATSNHKFLLNDKTWKSIDSGLSIDDVLISLYSMPYKANFIKSIEYIDKREVYDLTVEK